MTIKYLFFVLLLTVTTSNAQQLKQPSFLKVGDSVAIVAPAGILKPSRKAVVLSAKKLLEGWGLKVVIGNHVFKNGNHFAGTDAQRCQDFQKALDNPNIKAIWAARGGYGSVRILDKLDFTKFLKHPKWVIGYSDITAFHNHINNLGVQTLHAMMATTLEDAANDTKQTIATFKKALFGTGLSYKIASNTNNRVLNKTIIKGNLVGGNLAILASMLGSNSQIDTSNSILFIEEIGEYKYAIDRMLQSLKRAGYFKNVKAVVIGDMSKIRKNSTKWGSSIEQLILEVVPKTVPVLFDFPAGHKPDNRALFFGKTTTLTLQSNAYTLSFKL